MLFAIGTRVRLRFTGERGTIVGKLDDGMLQVRLDDDPDFEIPTFEEDLLRDTDLEPRSPGAKFVPGKKVKEPEAPPRREVRLQYVVLKPKGLQLAFEPMPGKDGAVSRYQAWLINDTSFEFLVEVECTTHSADVFFNEDKLGATTALELGQVKYDDLNDQLEVWMRIRRLTTAGPDEPLDRTLKVRPKQFFNSLQTAPVLNVLTHLFVVFDSFEPPTDAPKEDLRDYTRQQVSHPRSRRDPDSTPVRPFDPEAFAKFEPEIDLHIEKLMTVRARLDKSEILRIQLLHFQRFLDQAIRLGVSNVFIIHGVGEGKLREAIADRLRENPHVRKFKNEYHHKYGYGATEVWL